MTLKVTFTVDDTGEEFVADATGHDSMMQVALDNDVPYIEGECGGEMSCATCHVWVESTPEGYDSERSTDEEDMLDVVSDPRDESRLSCQLRVTPSIDGLAVRVPTP